MASFGGAVHGSWCGSRTYPTTCRYCGRHVFYFSCDCGCKVFFDALGDPWPQHNCQERALTELGTERVQEYMAELMMTPHIWQPGHSLEPAWLNKLEQRLAAPRAFQPRLIRENAVPGARRDDTGYIRELAPGKPAKALGLDLSTPMGQAVLRCLSHGDCMQLTVHCGDLSSENGSSYTFLVDRSLVGRAELQIGYLVWFDVEAFVLPGRPPIWMCRALERL